MIFRVFVPFTHQFFHTTKVMRSSVKLVNLSVNCCCVRYGRCIPLKMAMDEYPMWDSYTPLNLRHDTRAPDSPFSPKTGDPLHIMCIMISLSCQDAAGLPISSDAEYWNTTLTPEQNPMLGALVMRNLYTEGNFGLRFGRMRWDAKFKDCLCLVIPGMEGMEDGGGTSAGKDSGTAAGGREPKLGDRPQDGIFVRVNMDNFSRVVRSPVGGFLDAGGAAGGSLSSLPRVDEEEKNAERRSEDGGGSGGEEGGRAGGGARDSSTTAATSVRVAGDGRATLSAENLSALGKSESKLSTSTSQAAVRSTSDTRLKALAVMEQLGLGAAGEELG